MHTISSVDCYPAIHNSIVSTAAATSTSFPEPLERTQCAMPDQIRDTHMQDVDDEENYISSEDEDFNPETAAAAAAAATQAQASSDSEASDEDGTVIRVKSNQPKQRKQHSGDAEAEDLGFENSGDEGIIKVGAKEARRQQRKRKRRDSNADGGGREDSGGDGGFVETRSMRAAAYAIPFSAPPPPPNSGSYIAKERVHAC